MKLYKNKYLIAYYKEEELLFIVDNSAQFQKAAKKILGKEYLDVNSTLSHAFSDGSENIVFIDAYEIIEDVFTYEDKTFIEFAVDNRYKTNKEKAKENGVSERTFYRRLNEQATNTRKNR